MKYFLSTYIFFFSISSFSFSFQKKKEITLNIPKLSLERKWTKIFDDEKKSISKLLEMIKSSNLGEELVRNAEIKIKKEKKD